MKPCRRPRSERSDTHSISEDRHKPDAPRRKARPPVDIGWREWASLPGLGVERIEGKIDTGAKTSAIHAYRIREVIFDGAPHAEFYLHPERRRRKPEIFCRVPIADRRLIKSSNGEAQERIIIVTPLRIGKREWLIELSLANRDAMGFRFLIGRDALRRGFVIHPGQSFLLGD